MLQIPVRASWHSPLADYFKHSGPVLVREAAKKWAFFENKHEITWLRGDRDWDLKVSKISLSLGV